MRTYKNRVIFSLLLLAAFIALAFAGCGGASKAKSDIKVLVTFVSGIVEGQLGNDTSWKKLDTKAELTMADTVRTGEKSYARLSFPDGAKVFLEENTTLNLKEVKLPSEKSTLDIVVDIIKGAIFFDVSKRENSKFEMETSVAVAGVKGTRGVVRSYADGSKIIVTEGRVEVHSKDDPQNKVVLEPEDAVEVTKAKKLGAKEKLDLAKEKFAEMPLMKTLTPDDITTRIDVIKVNK